MFPFGVDKRNLFDIFVSISGLGLEEFQKNFLQMIPCKNHWIKEDDEYIYVILLLPGFEKKQVSLLADDATLKVKAIRVANEIEKKIWPWFKEDTVKFEKELTLPAEIDPTKTKAKFVNGELIITLKKKEKGHKVNVE